jgi:hypothetical protein
VTPHPEVPAQKTRQLPDALRAFLNTAPRTPLDRLIQDYIRQLEKEHRAMRNELELIHEGKGNWSGDVLRSLTLKP